MLEALRLSPLEKTRLDNLRRLIRLAGSPKGFCETTGIKRSYLSHIAGQAIRCPIGEMAARNLERKIGLPECALDVIPGSQPVNTLPSQVAEAVQTLLELPAIEQQRALLVLEALRAAWIKTLPPPDKSEVVDVNALTAGETKWQPTKETKDAPLPVPATLPR